MDTSSNSDSYLLDGIPICSKSITEIKSILMSALQNPKSDYQIITCNTDFLRIASIDPEFRSICKKSFMVVPDGVGTAFLVWLLYKIKIIRVTGSDLFDTCLEIANANSLKIALVGSSTEVLSKLKSFSHLRWPNAILFTQSPVNNFEYNLESNAAIIEPLKDFKPDILLVALGCPRQEKWIFNNQKIIGAKIGIGLGAIFDFYSGNIKRAPLIVQKIGFEWLWRLALEPIRLGKRYLLLDFPFLIVTSFKIIFRLK